MIDETHAAMYFPRTCFPTAYRLMMRLDGLLDYETCGRAQSRATARVPVVVVIAFSEVSEP